MDMTQQRARNALIGVIASIVLAGCASQQVDRSPTESNLTAGMAKATIKKGQTTQADVIEVFGPPDLVTHRDNLQIWTYDKVRYDVRSDGGTLIFYSASSLKSSSTSTMLIIYFDEQDIVQDYRMNVTRF